MAFEGLSENHEFDANDRGAQVSTEIPLRNRLIGLDLARNYIRIASSYPVQLEVGCTVCNRGDDSDYVNCKYTVK